MSSGSRLPSCHPQRLCQSQPAGPLAISSYWMTPRITGLVGDGPDDLGSRSLSRPRRTTRSRWPLISTRPGPGPRGNARTTSCSTSERSFDQMYTDHDMFGEYGLHPDADQSLAGVSTSTIHAHEVELQKPLRGSPHDFTTTSWAPRDLVSVKNVAD